MCGPNEPLERLQWPEAWGLIFVIPPTPLSTKRARAVLPETYSSDVLALHRDSVQQWVNALKMKDPTAFSAALTSDVLHEPYRKPLVLEWSVVDRVLASEAILGTVLSGAGSTLLVVTPSLSVTESVLMRLKQSPELAHCRVLLLNSSDAAVLRLA